MKSFTGLVITLSVMPRKVIYCQTCSSRSLPVVNCFCLLVGMVCLVVNVVCHFTAPLKKGPAFKLDFQAMLDFSICRVLLLKKNQKPLLFTCYHCLYTLAVRRCLPRQFLWIWRNDSFTVFCKDVPSFERRVIFTEHADVVHVWYRSVYI